MTGANHSIGINAALMETRRALCGFALMALRVRDAPP
jgi:hypothetical protein